PGPPFPPPVMGGRCPKGGGGRPQARPRSVACPLPYPPPYERGRRKSQLYKHSMLRTWGRHGPGPIFLVSKRGGSPTMTKSTKTRIFAALALTTALTAPAVIVPLFTAPPAVAGEAMPRDFSDLAAKVTPAVVNVAVTMKAESNDEGMQMSDRSNQEQMQEFMQE